MDYKIILNQILILFIIIAVGYVGAKKNIINEELNKGLSKILVNITLPFLIVSSYNFKFSIEMGYNSIILLFIVFFTMAFSIIISKFLFRKYNVKEQQVLRFVAVFSNCAFMGYPVVSSIYGKEGLFYSSIYNIIFILFLWTFGVFLFTENKDKINWKNILLNPGIVATVIGIIIFIFSIKLPIVIQGTLTMVGSMTIPISMLVIGSSLSKIKIKDMTSGIHIYYVSLIRLIILPILLIVILKPLNIAPIIKGTAVLLTAMPGAAFTTILASINDGDVELASRIVLISTLLSSITIPIIIFLI